MDISKDMWMEELLEKFPEAQDFLSRNDIICVQCGEAVWGSLENILKAKDYSDKEIDSLIKEINEHLKDKKTGGIKCLIRSY
jgi:hypothetical protein